MKPNYDSIVIDSPPIRHGCLPQVAKMFRGLNVKLGSMVLIVGHAWDVPFFGSASLDGASTRIPGPVFSLAASAQGDLLGARTGIRGVAFGLLS